VIWDSIGAPNNIVTDQTPAINKQYSIRYGIPTTALTPGTKDYSISIRAFLVKQSLALEH
jgi:hypothetical protein